MGGLAQVYRQYQGQVSLRGFMRIVDQPYWRLRDYLRAEPKRRRREQALAQAAVEVQAAAAEDSSYGYRRVYQHLREKGVEIVPTDGWMIHSAPEVHGWW